MDFKDITTFSLSAFVVEIALIKAQAISVASNIVQKTMKSEIISRVEHHLALSSQYQNMPLAKITLKRSAPFHSRFEGLLFFDSGGFAIRR